MTFLLMGVLNLQITCYVMPDVIRYCIVCKHGFQRRRSDSDKKIHQL